MTRSLLSSPALRRTISLLLVLATFFQHGSAERLIQALSLNPCMENSKFSATFFNITFQPDAGQLLIRVNGVSSIAGKVTAKVSVIAYGYSALTTTLDPCLNPGFEGMCPMNEGVIKLNSRVAVSSDVAGQIPAVAFQVPDLDGIARIMVNTTENNKMVACVEAPLLNGKTVDQPAVGWITAIIAGLGLIASAVTSGLGHSNTAAHVAANALSLFGYFQAQAMLGMSAVKLPPVVSAWTQNYDWAMGIIQIDFMQQIFHWYIQATGGSPTNLQEQMTEVSVRVQKRSLDAVRSVPYHLTRAAMYGFEETPLDTRSLPSQSMHTLHRRSNNNDNIATMSNTVIVVSGIRRVAFKAKIEITNFFMTGLSFFVIFLALTALGVVAFKWGSEFAIKAKWIRGTKFKDFRQGWLIVLKGIMYRLVLIGFPQMAVLCLWEFTKRDSSGAVTLAVFFILSVTGILVWASLKVIRIAQRSVTLHKNPAYILYSDPAALNRWGFLYVQFRASAYYFIVPLLFYQLVKAMFIAFGQKHGKLQAIALVLIELAYLVAVSVMRPWMDKRTNIFNISICAICFLNSIFLLVFTKVFNSPDIVSGVMGVIYFILNAAFALVLLILVLISSVYALVSKNPDVRYQPMRDDRGSFIKSNSQMITSTELEALSATARGDIKTRDLDEDDSLAHSSSINRGPPSHNEASQVPLPPSTAGSQTASSQREMPHSPVDPAVPLFPTHSHESGRSGGGGGGGGGGGYPQGLSPGGVPSRSPSAHSTYSQRSQYSQRGYNDYPQPPSSRGSPAPGGGYRPPQFQPPSGQPTNWNAGVGYDPNSKRY